MHKWSQIDGRLVYVLLVTTTYLKADFSASKLYHRERDDGNTDSDGRWRVGGRSPQGAGPAPVKYHSNSSLRSDLGCCAHTMDKSSPPPNLPPLPIAVLSKPSGDTANSSHSPRPATTLRRPSTLLQNTSASRRLSHTIPIANQLRNHVVVRSRSS